MPVSKKVRKRRLVALLIALLGLFLFTGSLAYGNTMPICATAPVTIESCVFLLATFWVGAGMVAVTFAYSVYSLALQLRQDRRLKKAWKETHKTENKTDESSSSN